MQDDAPILSLILVFTLYFLWRFRPQEWPSLSRRTLANTNAVRVEKNLRNLKAVLQRHGYVFKDEPDYRLGPLRTDNIAPIQGAVDELCEYCQLAGISVSATFKPLVTERGLSVTGPETVDVPGHTFQFARHRYSLWINPRYLPRPDAVTATLAHEMAHVYCFANEISFRSHIGQNHRASEQMTDLLAIALGLGRLLLRGARGTDGQLGYLSIEALEHAYAFWQEIRPRPIPGTIS